MKNAESLGLYTHIQFNRNKSKYRCNEAMFIKRTFECILMNIAF